MAKPKLALIPAAQGGKFYSVLPSDGVGDFQFSRLSSGTRIAPTGLIETVPTATSRLDYDLLNGKVVNCPHYILEPARTNVFNYSDDATNWSTSNSSVLATSNQVISPDGTLNADKLIPASGNVQSNGGRYRSFNSTAGTNYSVSVFVKQGEYRYVTFAYGSSSSIGFHFDLQDGVIIQELTNNQYASLGNKVEVIGNGWYRLTVSLTDSTSVNGRFIGVRPANARPTSTNNNYSTIGDGVSGIYVYGFQLEVGSYSTSYIPTTTTTITRAAESADGSGNAATFNDSEGVLMAEISALSDDGAESAIAIGNGTYDERVIIYTFNNYIYAFVFVGGANVFSLGTTEYNVKESNKIALKYKSGDYSIYINGIEKNSSTSTFTPSGLNRLNFNDSVSGLKFYGKTRELQYFDSALTDAQLETLTSWTTLQEMITSQLYINY